MISGCRQRVTTKSTIRRATLQVWGGFSHIKQVRFTSAWRHFIKLTVLTFIVLTLVTTAPLPGVGCPFIWWAPTAAGAPLDHRHVQEEDAKCLANVWDGFQLCSSYLQCLRIETSKCFDFTLPEENLSSQSPCHGLRRSS